jgi:hypothetical protein
MKRSFLVVALILAGFGLNANTGGESTSYVRTDNKVYFGQDVKMGLFNMKVISSDGTVTKIPKNEVLAYMENSRLFEYLPVVCENDDTLGYAMMEYVTTKQGLSLYCYTCINNNETKYGYFVYKGGKFYLKIDQKNAKTTLPFFGIKVV